MGSSQENSEDNTVSRSASNKSGCNLDLAGQMAGAWQPCRRFEPSCDLCDPEESVLGSGTRDEGHLLPYLHSHSQKYIHKMTTNVKHVEGCCL